MNRTIPNGAATFVLCFAPSPPDADYRLNQRGAPWHAKPFLSLSI